MEAFTFTLDEYNELKSMMDRSLTYNEGDILKIDESEARDFGTFQVIVVDKIVYDDNGKCKGVIFTPAMCKVFG